jgi:hypothetical protein
MIVVDGERLQIKGKAGTIKKEMATLLYGMQNRCPELLAECVDYLEALDELNPECAIWDNKRSNDGSIN